MKKIYIILVVTILFSITGCGYKDVPVYVEKQDKK